MKHCFSQTVEATVVISEVHPILHQTCISTADLVLKYLQVKSNSATQMKLLHLLDITLK